MDKVIDGKFVTFPDPNNDFPILLTDKGDRLMVGIPRELEEKAREAWMSGDRIRIYGMALAVEGNESVRAINMIRMETLKREPIFPVGADALRIVNRNTGEETPFPSVVHLRALEVGENAIPLSLPTFHVESALTPKQIEFFEALTPQPLSPRLAMHLPRRVGSGETISEEDYLRLVGMSVNVVGVLWTIESANPITETLILGNPQKVDG